MNWAIIAHPKQFIRGRLVVAPETCVETCLPTALAQGWIVVARDSEMVSSDPPAQTNPPHLPLP